MVQVKMALTDTVVIDAGKWHQICHELEFDQDRKEQFQECFDCTVTWKSRLDEWVSDNEVDRPGPIMLLRFMNPVNASLFVLNWL